MNAWLLCVLSLAIVKMRMKRGRLLKIVDLAVFLMCEGKLPAVKHINIIPQMGADVLKCKVCGARIAYTAWNVSTSPIFSSKDKLITSRTSLI